MFSDVLTNSGQVGICDEWFNEKFWALWQEMTNRPLFNLKDYLKWVARKTVGDTGVLSVHMHIGQLMYVTKTFEVSLGDMSFDHVVWIYREDKIGQAVSLARAVSVEKHTRRAPEGQTRPIVQAHRPEAVHYR